MLESLCAIPEGFKIRNIAVQAQQQLVNELICGDLTVRMFFIIMHRQWDIKNMSFKYKYKDVEVLAMDQVIFDARAFRAFLVKFLRPLLVAIKKHSHQYVQESVPGMDQLFCVFVFCVMFLYLVFWLFLY